MTKGREKKPLRTDDKVQHDTSVTQPSGGSTTGIRRRDFLTGTAATVTAATVLPNIRSARAQSSGPIKIGHIEDLSGNLAVYGVQKYHAALLAVKEINEGKTLKGGPVGSGVPEPGGRSAPRGEAADPVRLHEPRLDPQRPRGPRAGPPVPAGRRGAPARPG